MTEPGQHTFMLTISLKSVFDNSRRGHIICEESTIGKSVSARSLEDTKDMSGTFVEKTYG